MFILQIYEMHKGAKCLEMHRNGNTNLNNVPRNIRGCITRELNSERCITAPVFSVYQNVLYELIQYVLPFNLPLYYVSY